MKIILLREYQSNIENCLVFSPKGQIRFSNLPDINRSFLLVGMGNFLQKAPLSNLQKTIQNTKQDFPLFSWMCSCILSSWENGIPLNKLFTLRGRLFNPQKGKHVLKHADSDRCEANTLRILDDNFSTFFLGFSKGFILEIAYRI